jgi:DNA polymerase III subunit delta
MARAPARKKEPGFDLEGALAEVRGGRPAPVYLLDGEPFLALRGARAIVEALVPEPQRALNLVELDAATSPAEVAAELSTGGLFGGSKAVLLQDPAFLQAKEDLAGAFERASDMWGQGRQREAARRLVALAARFGWSTADLSREGGPSAREWAAKLGVGELRPADAAYLAEGGRCAAEKGMVAAKDDTSALEALLERGLPPGHVLVVAAGKVDGRLPLVKRLAGAGHRIPCAVETEGTWDDQHPVLGKLIAEMLEGTGKAVDRAAEARLAGLLGGDARALAGELRKLAAYVGDRKEIRAADVEAVVVRMASDPFFALGNAVESRDLEAALGVFRRTLADGGSPHMVVASLAGTVRRLLVERERARVAAGDARLAGFGDWSARVLPTVTAEELGNRKPYGLWMKYQASLRFAREELLDALAALAEADHAMKSGADGEILLERCLLGICAPARDRRTA